MAQGRRARGSALLPVLLLLLSLAAAATAQQQQQQQQQQLAQPDYTLYHRKCVWVGALRVRGGGGGGTAATATASQIRVRAHCRQPKPTPTPNQCARTRTHAHTRTHTRTTKPTLNQHKTKRDDLLAKARAVVDANAGTMRWDTHRAADGNYSTEMVAVTVRPGGIGEADDKKVRLLMVR